MFLALLQKKKARRAIGQRPYRQNNALCHQKNPFHKRVRSRLMPAESVNSPMLSQARPHRHNAAMPCHQVPGLLVIFRVLPPNGILFFIMIYLLFICSTFRFSLRMHGSPVFFFPSLCYTKL